MRRTVDVKRAHTADTLAAVVVEHERLLTSIDEFLVEDVEHLQERSVVGDVLHLVRIEMTLILRAVLLPILNCE